MSKRQMEVLVDDIDGTPIVDESQGRSIPVKIGDIETTLDLTNENIARLEETFREFISAGEGNVATRNSTTRRTSPSTTEDLSVIREWARKNGYDINARGRIPFSVMDAFTKAHMGKLR
jgi:hypothetical protein